MTPPGMAPDGLIESIALANQMQAAHRQMIETQAAELEVQTRRTMYTWAAFICTCPRTYQRDNVTGTAGCALHSGLMLHYATGEVIMG